MKPLAGLLLVIGCLSLAGAAAPGGSASCRCRTIADLRPVWSPADDALVYATTEDAPQIFRFAEGHDTTLRFPVGTHDFTLSPDWSMVAALMTESIAPGAVRDVLVVFGRDGSALRRLDEESFARPVWAPSGDRIAYVRRGGDTYDLFTVGPDGSDRMRVAARVSPSGAAASWSPDGSMIAYSSGGDVFVARADGSGARNITAGFEGVHDDPLWSQDGRRIAFVANRVAAIGVAALDGTPILRAASGFPTNASGLVLSWAPDGRHIVYSAPAQPAPMNKLGILEVEVATGAQRVVTRFGADASYSRDGTRIAFGGQPTTEPNPPEAPDCVGVGVWVVSPAGGRPTLVTRHCNQTPASISAHAPARLVYGDRGTLGGQLLPGFGEFVREFVQPCGRRASTRYTESRNGTWSRLIAPIVTTHYSVASDVERMAVTVSVSPRLELRRSGRLFELRVTAARSFAGRRARIEEVRQDNSITSRSVLLRKATPRISTARFQLAKDASGSFQAIHAVLPASQCYASGVSNELVVAP